MTSPIPYKDFLFVPVPEDAIEFNIIRLANWINVCWRTSKDGDWSHISIENPDRIDYKLKYTYPGITEEQAKEVVEEDWINQFEGIKDKWYKDYSNPQSTLRSALESFQTLLTHLGFCLVNPMGERPVNTVNPVAGNNIYRLEDKIVYDKYEQAVKQWLAAEEKVVKKILILKKV